MKPRFVLTRLTLGAFTGLIVSFAAGAAKAPSIALFCAILGAFLMLKIKPAPKLTRNDRAEMAPISILLVAILVMSFEAVVYGNDLAATSIVTSVSYNTCATPTGFFTSELGWIACNVANFFLFIINVFLVIFSVVAFFFNALTFNVPDAPFYVRIAMGTFFIGSIGWAIASLLRGTKA